MGAYGRSLRYVAAIKREVALKVLIGLAISTTYIGQALVMAKAVSVVFVGLKTNGEMVEVSLGHYVWK